MQVTSAATHSRPAWREHKAPRCGKIKRFRVAFERGGAAWPRGEGSAFAPRQQKASKRGCARTRTHRRKGRGTLLALRGHASSLQRRAAPRCVDRRARHPPAPRERPWPSRRQAKEERRPRSCTASQATPASVRRGTRACRAVPPPPPCCVCLPLGATTPVPGQQVSPTATREGGSN